MADSIDDLTSLIEKPKIKGILSEVYSKADNGNYSHSQLTQFHTVDNVKKQLYCVEDKTGVGRLFWKALDQEAIFKVQGVLAGHNLPVFLGRMGSFNPTTSSQDVTLVGGMSTSFQNALAATRAFHTFFTGSYTEGLVHDYEESFVGSLPSLNFRTRYFSPKANNYSVAIPIPHIMDPSGSLGRRLQQLSRFKFTLENLVEYYKRSVRNDGEEFTVVEPVSPRSIRRGLIVELDVIFILVNSRGRKRMIPSFKKLTIIDDGCVFDINSLTFDTTAQKRGHSDVDDQVFFRMKLTPNVVS